MKTSLEIRQLFFDFFQSKQHQIVSSAPIVVKNDPTLMFTNAGMNQFKDIFLDNKRAEYTRVANSQKCLRVSGKHNDLEEVGHDTYHHTMFEMLGNWSFGDYFKKEAIAWAFELLKDVYNISENIMYATYFEGDKSENLEADAEVKSIWEQFLPKERVLPGNKKDNFWEMGETGPCGPSSELHLDLRSEEEKKRISGSLLVNKDHPQVIEIWNLVFIQFNRDAKGQLHLLKNKHVDTGMGFERLCRVVQQKNSNYDIDIFAKSISKISEISGIKYGDKNETDIAFRVIADHVRAVAFSIADGQIPSNVKAGYVIRRILRRAVRYAYTFLKLDQPFIYLLVEGLVEDMGHSFPELQKQQQLIENIIFQEESSFLRTLQIGIEKFEEYISKHSENKILEGKFVFELYDTFGFPIDLTALMAKEKNYTVDMQGFEALLNQQKERSRKDAAAAVDDWIILLEQQKTEFVGYDVLTSPVNILKYRSTLRKGKTIYHLVFDKTPFYAESGGQIGDTGYISNDGGTVQIIDTKKEIDMIIHVSEELPKDLRATFNAVVNEGNRQKIKNNHTATHLMHFALRKILGEHVEQKGSLVATDYLRFDFSHFNKMDSEEILQVEKIVNDIIRSNVNLIENRYIPYNQAIDEGAIALFGEKYEDVVRTIRFGSSIELCGGTHVSQTGEIGLFKIISEGAIAAGIRRIEAITGSAAFNLMQEQWKVTQELKLALNNQSNLVEAVENLKDTLKGCEKKIEEMEVASISEKAKDLIKDAQIENGILTHSWQLSLPHSHIKTLAFEMRKIAKQSFYFVFGNIHSDKVSLTIILSDDLTENKGLHAGNIIKELSKEIKGGGGGQAQYATAGGTDKTALPNVLQKALEKITIL